VPREPAKRAAQGQVEPHGSPGFVRALYVELSRIGNPAGLTLVANADHGREAILPQGALVPDTAVQPQGMQDLDLDTRRDTGREAAEFLGEGVRALLLQQPRAPSSRLGPV